MLTQPARALDRTLKMPGTKTGRFTARGAKSSQQRGTDHRTSEARRAAGSQLSPGARGRLHPCGAVRRGVQPEEDLEASAGASFCFEFAVRLRVHCEDGFVIPADAAGPDIGTSLKSRVLHVRVSNIGVFVGVYQRQITGWRSSHSGFNIEDTVKR